MARSGDDGSGRFAFRTVGSGQRHAGARRGIGLGQADADATLDFAAMANAGDGFLAGVAALAETDRTQGIEIQHLGDELCGGFRRDEGFAGPDGEQGPSVRPHGRAPNLQPLPQFAHIFERAQRQPARGSGERDQQAVLRGDGAECLGGQIGAEKPRQVIGQGFAGDAEPHEGIRGVLQRNPGPQDETAQLCQRFFQLLTGQQEVEVVAAHQQHETRDHLALGTEIAAERGLIGGYGIDVRGQLGLQEAARVRAMDTEQAEMSQIGDDRTGENHASFPLRVAEVGQHAIREFGAGIDQERHPFRLHGKDSSWGNGRRGLLGC